MIPRLLRYFVRAIALVFVVLATATCAVVYLVTSEPAFYAKAAAETYTAADADRIKQELEVIRSDFLTWHSQSFTLGNEQQQATLPRPALDARAPYTARLTEQQLNTLLATSQTSRLGEASQPRVRIAADRLDVGIRVVDESVNFVLSAALRPSATADGDIKLEILALRIGNLPMPLKTLLTYLPPDMLPSGRDVEWHPAATTPYVVYKPNQHDVKQPRLKSIACQAGAVVLELEPPTPPAPRQIARSRT